jgi:hypothetical protein
MQSHARRVRSTSTAPFGPLALAALALVAGCPDAHVGRPCELAATADAGSGSGAITTLASPSLECPSRICLLPGAEQAAGGTGPLCTAPCASDSDCADAETDAAPGGPRCKHGFGCAWPTTVGAFACQRMCVCLDFVQEPPGGFTEPAACLKR